MSSTLYGLDYSPWTERARWALDHHHLEHRFVQHVPMVGEVALRWRAWRSGAARPSVPLLVHDGRGVQDSYDIMKHADAVGAGAPLRYEPESCDEVHRACERALEAGRARVVMRTLADPAALGESARAVAPEFLTPLLRPVSAMGARYLARKYGAPLDSPESRDQVMREVLTELSTRLGDREYLHDRFGAADILLATLMQAVQPVEGGYIELTPAVRECWRSEALAREFAHLLEWRDRIYAVHRRPRAGSAAA